MQFDEALKLVVDKVPTEYPKHMLCYFAANAARGVVLPFTAGLCRTLAEIDSATPGYAAEMTDRLAGIAGTGEEQYEAVLQILAEVYVTQGVVAAASQGGRPRRLSMSLARPGRRTRNAKPSSRARGARSR